MAIINGALSIPDPGESGEYQGEISLKLPKAKIAAYAAMRLHPKYPAFVVDANVDLPKPIPIGPVGIYGFRGLLGYRYLVEKEAVGLASDAKWQEYYKAPPRGIHISKFSQPEDTENYQNPIALGAGAIFGTSFDGGSLLSVRAMLVLSLPTAVVIDGSASILAKRIGLDSPTEPPFYAFAAWGPNSLEFGIGADYSIPDTGNNRGWLLDIQADVEAYFPFNNPSGWYVNFGTEQNRVSAEFLTLFTTQSYLMLSSQGIRAGAKASFLLEKRFGPAKVKISAYVEVGGQISFERPQIGGFIGAGGQILVDIWVLKLDIGLDALLAVEAAKPFLIYAKLDVRGCIKVLFAKVCKSFTVKLKWEYDSTVDRTPVPPLPYTNSSRETDRTEELVKGVHMLTNKTYPIQKLEVRNSGVAYIPNAANIDTIIPLDTYIDLKSVKGLIPNINSQKIGGNVSGAHNYTDLIPPQKVVRGGNELRQVKHKYSIEEIELKIWSGNSWEDYEPFKAVVEEEERDQLPSLIGYWQSDKQYNTIRLMATTPMTYTEAGEPGWYVPEEHGITASQLFCKDEERSIHCGNFLNKEVGKEYFPPAQYYGHYINGAYFTLEGTYYVYDDLEDNQDKFLITNRSNTHGFNKSLQFENHKHLVLLLEEPSIEVRLKLNSDASSVTISYYKSVISAGIIPVYELIHEEQKTAAELQNEVIYINENEHISKVIIRPVEANQEEIAQLEQEIAAMFQQDYRNSNGIITGGIPANPELYQELKDQLDSLRGAGCSIDRGGDNDGSREWRRRRLRKRRGSMRSL
ncbi:hypothetical protein ACFSO9_16125 [Mesonia maritima]|uniref:hypothetical protein n=1 Tax=Mesonia maritima TaxID=1793873 RepID=UPI00363CC506